MPKNHFKICVSGAAAGKCLTESRHKALLVGRAIAKQGAILVTGATTGIPYLAAKGCKKAGGTVIGFSPAATEKEHTRKFRLPTDSLDLIVYTGFGYAGRNLILTRASDAVIMVCGRIGTLNEFTIAFEDKKIIGILARSGGITDEIPRILRIAKRGMNHVIFDDSPDRLVRKVLSAARAEHKNGLRKLTARKRGQY
jgi:hypothetical protein